jgi:hypothetical protein
VLLSAVQQRGGKAKPDASGVTKHGAVLISELDVDLHAWRFSGTGRRKCVKAFQLKRLVFKTQPQTPVLERECTYAPV